MNPGITKLANSCARRHGAGKATDIVFDDVPEPALVRHLPGGFVKKSDGTPVSNAYRRKAWSSTEYSPAVAVVAMPLRYQLLPDH
jgi:hypothetical protein